MILTIRLDEISQQYFNALRKEHFPAPINYLDAHLTLFHNIPDTLPSLDDILSVVAKRDVFEMEVGPPAHTGFGVAYKIKSVTLTEIHKQLSAAFSEWLIPQDKQKFQPHITVQNKVTSAQSKSLAISLAQIFETRTIQALGFSYFEYLGGPWKHIRDYNFFASDR